MLGEDSMSCRVVVKEITTVPPWSEKLVHVEIQNAGYISEDGLVQPNPDLVETHEVLALPGVVSAHSDNVHIRVVNFGSEESILYPQQKLGTCESCDDSLCDQELNRGHIAAVTSTTTQIPDHLKELIATVDLTGNDLDEFVALLRKYQHIFAKDKHDLGRTNLIRHRINTGPSRPIRKPPRRLPLGKREIEHQEIRDMLDRDVIQPSVSPWASPIVLVTKKDGTTRFCVDYRALNDCSVKDAYPLPTIDDSLDALSGSKFFNTMDLMSGYWQITMDPEDQEKTAFTTSLGLYEFKVMPFGLANAPATFERLMETVLCGLQWEECLVYIDDIIIPGVSVGQCLERIDHVFERLAAANLKLKPSNYDFFKRSVQFLGHIVSEEGVHTDPGKIEAVKNWPEPTTVKQVRSFLGLCSYYRRFIEGFASIARPLHKLTNKAEKFQWTSHQQQSFDQLKIALTTAPILAYPKAEGQYTLDTDASDEAVGEVLSQEQDECERVVAYYSKALSKAERVYCVTRKELLAVVQALKHFHPYIYGRTVVVRPDNAAVSWMKNLKAPTGQTARWLQLIGNYDLKVVHRAGRIHSNADALSRIPCSSCRRQACNNQKQRLDYEACSHLKTQDEISPAGEDTDLQTELEEANPS